MAGVAVWRQTAGAPPPAPPPPRPAPRFRSRGVIRPIAQARIGSVGGGASAASASAKGTRCSRTRRSPASAARTGRRCWWPPGRGRSPPSRWTAGATVAPGGDRGHHRRPVPPARGDDGRGRVPGRPDPAGPAGDGAGGRPATSAPSRASCAASPSSPSRAAAGFEHYPVVIDLVELPPELRVGMTVRVAFELPQARSRRHPYPFPLDTILAVREGKAARAARRVLVPGLAAALRRRRPRPCEQPEFRRLWFSTFAWNFARLMEMTITGWVALELTGSPWLVAMTGVFRSAFLPIAGPITGALSDRFDRVTLMKVAQWGNVLVISAVACALLAGRGAYWQIVLSGLWLGLSWGIDWPSRRALMADLVGPERRAPGHRAGQLDAERLPGRRTAAGRDPAGRLGRRRGLRRPGRRASSWPPRCWSASLAPRARRETAPGAAPAPSGATWPPGVADGAPRRGRLRRAGDHGADELLPLPLPAAPLRLRRAGALRRPGRPGLHGGGQRRRGGRRAVRAAPPAQPARPRPWPSSAAPPGPASPCCSSPAPRRSRWP